MYSKLLESFQFLIATIGGVAKDVPYSDYPCESCDYANEHKRCGDGIKNREAHKHRN